MGEPFHAHIMVWCLMSLAKLSPTLPYSCPWPYICSHSSPAPSILSTWETTGLSLSLLLLTSCPASFSPCPPHSFFIAVRTVCCCSCFSPYHFFSSAASHGHPQPYLNFGMPSAASYRARLACTDMCASLAQEAHLQMSCQNTSHYGFKSLSMPYCPYFSTIGTRESFAYPPQKYKKGLYENI